MPSLPAILALFALSNTFFDINSLFNFTASLVALLFILVVALVFVYVYDNLRRGKKSSNE